MRTKDDITNKRKRKHGFLTGAATIILVVASTILWLASAQSAPTLSNIELLGKYVFFDKISTPSRMACVTCHNPSAGSTGGVSGVNLHQVAITGANPHTVGNLKPPTNAYASFIDRFGPCTNGAASLPGVCGGNFWNGRAEGQVSSLPGATKHIGDEVFVRTDGSTIADPDVSQYAKYFGPTADQALNPMPNPVEQNIERVAVCLHVQSAKYAKLYKQVWGVDIDCSDTPVTKVAPDVSTEKAFDISFKRIMLAVCAWQASPDLNSFSSKRDIALKNDSDGLFPLDGFTDQENLGHDLFYNRLPVFFLPKGVDIGQALGIPPLTGVLNNPPFPDLPITNCSLCHSDHPEFLTGKPADTGVEPRQRYADSGFHNIGTPPNPEIPLTFDANGNPINPDLGLVGHTGRTGPLPGLPEGDKGLQKTPTMRNVDKRPGNDFTKAYTHNGWFKSLESIVHFYNTALIGGATANSFGVTQCPANITTEKDALTHNCWPAPASQNGIAIGALIGDMGLTREQEAAIVAYLKTLTDTYTPKEPLPYK